MLCGATHNVTCDFPSSGGLESICERPCVCNSQPQTPNGRETRWSALGFTRNMNTQRACRLHIALRRARPAGYGRSRATRWSIFRPCFCGAPPSLASQPASPPQHPCSATPSVTAVGGGLLLLGLDMVHKGVERLVGGRVGGGVKGTVGVVQRLLEQRDRVAQLLLDGGLRGAQRCRQVDTVAVLRVQLRAGARGGRVRGRARGRSRGGLRGGRGAPRRRSARRLSSPARAACGRCSRARCPRG